jgi:hypothetical protein
MSGRFTTGAHWTRGYMNLRTSLQVVAKNIRTYENVALKLNVIFFVAQSLFLKKIVF